MFNKLQRFITQTCSKKGNCVSFEYFASNENRTVMHISSKYRKLWFFELESTSTSVSCLQGLSQTKTFKQNFIFC